MAVYTYNDSCLQVSRRAWHGEVANVLWSRYVLLGLSERITTLLGK